MRWSNRCSRPRAPSSRRSPRRLHAPSVPAQTLQAGQHPVPGRGRLDRARAAPRPRGDQRRHGRRLVACDGRRPGTRRQGVAVRRRQHPGRLRRRRSARRRCRACRALRPGPARARQGARRRGAGCARSRRLRRPRRRPHRRRAARRRRGCRWQHSRHRGEHRRAHGADRAGRGLAHQPRCLRPGARHVRGRASGAAGRQGRRRADPELSGAARQGRGAFASAAAASKAWRRG